MASESKVLPAWVDALREEDFHFLKRFIVASGSLKALAGEYGVSYPTVRARLDRLIAKVIAAEESRDADTFERKLSVLVADALIPTSIARELLEAHRLTRKPGEEQ